MKYLLWLMLLFPFTYLHSQWETDVRLTDGFPEASFQWDNGSHIGAFGDTVYVAFERDREIYYMLSTDSGVNWGNEIQLSNDTAYVYGYGIYVSGFTVHFIWVYNNYLYTGDNFVIYYKRSIDGGENWSNDIKISSDDAIAGAPSLSVSGPSLHIVWLDQRDGSNEIYYNHSSDNGLTWGTDTRITNNLTYLQIPTVKASGLDVHVVSVASLDSDYEILYMHSTDGGNNWGSPIQLNQNVFQSLHPSIAVSGNNVHVVWDEGGLNAQIFYCRSTDNGLNWETEQRLTNSTGTALVPKISVSDSILHIVWIDIRNSINQIYYKRSVDNGVNWETDVQLTTNSSAIKFAPSVISSKNVVHVFWVDTRDGYKEIYYKRNPNGNITAVEFSPSTICLSYHLAQNFPNPFNPATTIGYGVEVKSNVKITILNTIGEEVAVVLNEEKEAGYHEVEFNASSLPSGVYFYRLQNGYFMQTRKMILLK